MKKEIKIGLFGFGSVGRGLYDVLGAVEGKDITIRRICVRDLSKDRGVAADFTDQPDRIFEDPEINMIVELIDDADAAYRTALEAGASPDPGWEPQDIVIGSQPPYPIRVAFVFSPTGERVEFFQVK